MSTKRMYVLLLPLLACFVSRGSDSHQGWAAAWIHTEGERGREGGNQACVATNERLYTMKHPPKHTPAVLW